MATFTDRLKLANPDEGSCNWAHWLERNRQIIESVEAQTANGNFTVAGCAVTAGTGLFIDLSVGTVNVAGTEFAITGGNIPVTAATSEIEQYNIVYVDDTGTVNITPVDSPPTGEYAAIAVVDTDVSDVLRIGDLRCYGGGGGGVGDFLGLSDTPSSYTGSGGAGLRVNEAETGVEFGGDIIPQAGVILTGNILGLDYSMNSASPTDTIDIGGGSCYDSLNQDILQYSGGSAQISAPVANTIYNIFLTDLGDVQFDTDVGGANLLAGAVSQLRWIGFVLTGAAVTIEEFSMSGDLVEVNSITVATGLTDDVLRYEFSDFFPVGRCSGYNLWTQTGDPGNAARFYYDNDGVSASAQRQVEVNTTGDLISTDYWTAKPSVFARNGDPSRNTIKLSAVTIKR